MVDVLSHLYRPAVDRLPAMPPVGAAFLLQESPVTAASTQSVCIPDSVVKHAREEIS